MPSSYKLSSVNLTRVRARAMLDELSKLGAINDEEAAHALKRYESLQESKPDLGQVARYSALGAATAPLTMVAENVIKGENKANWIKKAPGHGPIRAVAGRAAAGAIGMGLLPIVRHGMDRAAEKAKLKKYLAEHSKQNESIKTAGPMQWLGHHLPTEHSEHLTDLAGLGMMAAGSGSHLYSQLSGQGEEGGPLSPTTQSGLDLAGLATMAAPTVAALSSLRRGHLPEHLAGGGSKFTNWANLAGLTALAVPTADKIQARLRSHQGEDPEHKMLLGDKAHRALELGGYGALSAPLLRNIAHGKAGLGDAAQLAGYATLAAPQVVPFEGPARTGSELAGLGLLGAPVVAGMMHR